MNAFREADRRNHGSCEYLGDSAHHEGHGSRRFHYRHNDYEVPEHREDHTDNRPVEYENHDCHGIEGREYYQHYEGHKDHRSYEDYDDCDDREGHGYYEGSQDYGDYCHSGSEDDYGYPESTGSNGYDYYDD